MSEDITVYSILDEWLEQHGYDGLYRPEECSCRRGMLMEYCERGFGGAACMPGYIVSCDEESDPDGCGGCGGCHIGPDKPKATL